MPGSVREIFSPCTYARILEIITSKCSLVTTSIKTVDFGKAPSHLKFNPYIKTGYRPQLTPQQCFLSLFVWSNETINIWSHLMGLFIFIGLLCYDLVFILPDSKIIMLPHDTIVGFFILVSFMICMSMSVMYHTLNCVSAEVCRRWFSMDILGISLAFYAVFLSGIFYGFWCPEHMMQRNLYLTLVTSVFACSLLFVLVPSLSGEEWHTARLRLFAGWAASGVLPTAHWLLLHWSRNDTIIQVFLPRIVTMYVISGVAMLLYVYQLPEKLLPGYFDRLGSSHQLWHVLVTVALVYWHHTGLLYARHRSVHGCFL
ncbi:progestin and adipoQ receptor family member 3 [Hyalella azteca]|uniref:Progestin and adipoQ receptor family member 3 n=1 Tax=Hyalella azteca TaxID=294128 RepID=A0A8B7NIW1_HYAAZ|nr:progestin and adipoQ receptor family member 3 [Hyalella azteca]